MNSSLVAVAGTDFRPFIDLDAGLQRKVLSMRNLTKAYHVQHKVLDGISFSLYAGEMVGVIGRSDAGKSMLLHVLNGTHSASGGGILSYPEVDMPHDASRLKGHSLSAWCSQCGMIFQDLCLVPRLDAPTSTLLGHLSQTLVLKSLFRVFPEADRTYAIVLLEWISTLPCALQRAENPSGGQMQRMAICRALMQNPGILLTDEPVASLDPKNTQYIVDVPREISKQSTSVMVNLHSVELVKAYCARVIGAASDRLIFDDYPSRLAQDILQRLYDNGVSQLH